MGTAAVLDAVHKDNRRKDLERQISDARNELARVTEQPAANDENCPIPPQQTTDAHASETTRALEEICITEAALLRQASRAGLRKFAAQHMKNSLRHAPELETWKTPCRLAELEEYLAVEDSESEVLHREPLSSVHMSRVSDMINTLVDELMVEAYKHPRTGDQQTPDIIDSGWNFIRMLRNDGYPRFGDPAEDVQATDNARQRLNQVNENIVADWDLQRKGQHPFGWEYRKFRAKLIYKICHNLLISPVAPGIQNYNSLMLGFMRLREKNLAQAVADSFLVKSRLRPTHGTMLLLLHHYRLKKDMVGFYSIIRRLHGEHHRGIGLRRRTTEAVEKARPKWTWMQELQQSDVTIGWEFLNVRANFDRHMVHALLDGLIDFDRIRHAALLLAACLKDGYEISSDYLVRVVSMCLYQLDYVAARTLVLGLLDELDGVLSFILDDRLDMNRKLPGMLLQLLDLYALTLGPRNAVADDEISTRLQRLRQALQLRTALYRVNEIQRSTRIVHSKLLGEGADIDVDGALSTAELDIRRHSRREARVDNFITAATLKWFGGRYTILKERLTALEASIFNILIRPASRQCPFPVVFDKSLPLSWRMTLYRKARNDTPLSTQIVWCHMRFHGLDLRQRRMLLQALDEKDQRVLLKDRDGLHNLPLKDIVGSLTRHITTWKDGERSTRTMASPESLGTAEMNSAQCPPSHQTRSEFMGVAKKLYQQSKDLTIAPVA
jgi:hypothetical protein